MQYQSLDVAELDDEQLGAWQRMRTGPGLDSPLFAPSLVRLVAGCRENVRVAVAGDDGGTAALLPYWADGPVALPYAGPLSDMQAVICPAQMSLDLRQWLSSLGLRALHFNAQLASQAPLRPHLWKRHPFPFIDLSHGFEAYRQQRREAGSDELKESLRKGRKIQRELGELTLVTDSPDTRVLEQVLAWKAQQLEAIGAFNALRVSWVRRILDEAVALNEPDCQGMLCQLRVAGELAAGALAIRSGAVVHGWVMAFNPDPKFRKYSPGILMLTEILKAAPELGIRRVDLGRGPDPYKRSFQSGVLEVAEGSVDRRPLHAAVRRGLVEFRDWLGHSPLRRRLRAWINHRRYKSDFTR